jgi:hypothetical protein
VLLAGGFCLDLGVAGAAFFEDGVLLTFLAFEEEAGGSSGGGSATLFAALSASSVPAIRTSFE